MKFKQEIFRGFFLAIVLIKLKPSPFSDKTKENLIAKEKW